MQPAHQRLHAREPPGLDVELRLVVQEELSVLKRLVQLVPEHEALRKKVLISGSKKR